MRYGEQGILGGHAGGAHARIRGGGGGAGGLDPIGKAHVIWVDLDLTPPPPPHTPDEISWFRTCGGNLFHWNALEQIA